jgi:hypothetical protein
VKKSLAFLAAGTLGAGVIAAVGGWQRSFDRFPENPAADQTPAIVAPAPVVRIVEEQRRVYPYSIVPGGARSVEEAKRAMSDPAVRALYAAVNLKNLKQVTLAEDISGYVSYRFGDKIYWTSNKLHLKAGETVYTDGQNIVRGRCLNTYSTHPMMPTRPHEPTEVIMDTSVEVPVIAFSFPRPAVENPVLPAPGGIATKSSLGPGQRRWFFPIIPIIPPLHKHHAPPPPIPPPGPPTVVPEPRYSWVVPGALLALIFLGRTWKRRRSC